MLLAPADNLWLLSDSYIPHVTAAARAALADDGTRRLAAAKSTGSARSSSGAVGVLTVSGPVEYRQTFMGWLMGAVAMDVIGAEFAALVADPKVSAIILRVDSPGGTAVGTPELADQIFAARGKKPIYAIADGQCCSAAFWIASAVDPGRFFASPSAQLGSVGATTIHFDQSEKMAKDGIRPTIIRAPAGKIEGNPFEPLTPEARVHEQANINRLYSQFLAGVARNRGSDSSTVASRFGGGRVVDTGHAMANGMVDGIRSWPQLLSHVGGSTRATARSGAGESLLMTSQRAMVEQRQARAAALAVETAEFAKIKSSRRATLGTLRGLVVPFDTVSTVPVKRGNGQAWELVAPDAFDAVLDSAAEVWGTIGHDPDQKFASRAGGELRLYKTAAGLECEIDVPNNTRGESILRRVRRGECSGVSIAFCGATSKYQYILVDGIQAQRLTFGELFEVSLLFSPQGPTWRDTYCELIAD